jgi:hypothetical protein
MPAIRDLPAQAARVPSFHGEEIADNGWRLSNSRNVGAVKRGELSQTMEGFSENGPRGSFVRAS